MVVCQDDHLQWVCRSEDIALEGEEYHNVKLKAVPSNCHLDRGGSGNDETYDATVQTIRDSVHYGKAWDKLVVVSEGYELWRGEHVIRLLV